MTNGKVSLEWLFYKQKGRCYWCNCTMELGGVGEKSATRDHLIPKSRGGKQFVKAGKKRNKVCNLVAACRQCNQSRGNMDANEFRQLLKGGWSQKQLNKKDDGYGS